MLAYLGLTMFGLSMLALARSFQMALDAANSPESDIEEARRRC